MKRLITILMAAMMIASLAACFTFSSSAATDVIPSGQIWEGEELMRYYVGNDPLVLPYGQSILKHDNPDTGVYCSKMAHFAWKPTVIYDYVSFELDVTTQGEKDFMIKVTKAADYGIFGVFWDDVQIGSDIDCYSASVAFETVNLGKYTVFPGKHTLTFKIMGGNPEKTNAHYMIGVDYFELIGSDGKSRVVTAETEGENYGVITKLENGAIRYEGESMKKSESCIQTNGWVEGTDFRIQEYYKKYCTFNFGKHFLFNATYPGCEFELEFEVEEDGEYSTVISSGTAPEFGIVDFEIDGQKVIEGLDLYSSPNCPTKVKEGNNIMLTAGTHTIKILIVDSNDQSTSCYASLDYLEINKVGEYRENTVTTTKPVEETTTEAPVDETTAPVDETTTAPTVETTTTTPINADTTTEKAPDNTTKAPVSTTTASASEGGCGSFSVGTFALALMSVISLAAVSLIKKK